MITVVITWMVVAVLVLIGWKAPGDARIKNILFWIVVAAMLLWTLDAVGGLEYVGVHLPHVHPAGCSR